MAWKDFFYFSRRERQGVLLLIVFIAGVFAGKWIFSPAGPQPLEEPEFVEKANMSTNVSPDIPEEQPAYVPIYNNRQSIPRKPPVPSSQETKKTYYEQPQKELTISSNKSNYTQIEKFAEGTVIELNEADTLALMRIPGIGPSFAKRITGYRNLLGSYHRIEQLQEVYGMYEELYIRILPYLKVNPTMITRIPVNSASLDKLKAHPYINFYQAKAIVELRKKKGTLSGVDDLKLLEEFSPDDWVRTTPYLEF